MAGVEVLNTIYTYASLINPNWFILCLVSLFTIAIIGMFTMDYNIVQKILFRCSLLLTLALIVCGIGMTITTEEVIDTKYEVIISDEVSMNEFNEKYEIIEQRGKIYTVKERN